MWPMQERFVRERITEIFESGFKKAFNALRPRIWLKKKYQSLEDRVRQAREEGEREEEKKIKKTNETEQVTTTAQPSEVQPTILTEEEEYPEYQGHEDDEVTTDRSSVVFEETVTDRGNSSREEMEEDVEIVRGKAERQSVGKKV